MNTQKNIAVIGAGISGLACAYDLQKNGHNVTVFEKEKTVGGRMRSRKVNGFTFDIGADHLCNLYTELISLSKEFDVEWQRMDFLQYGILKNGKVEPIRKALPLSEAAKLLVFTKRMPKVETFFNLNEAANHDTDNGYNTFKEKVGINAAEYFANGITSTYQFHGANEMSTGVLYAFMRSIQKDKEKWFLHQTEGGMSTIPEKIAEKLTVHTNTQVEAVTPNENSVTVKTNSEELEFDTVVLATTTNVTQKILQNQTEDQKSLLENTEYAPTISLAFVIDQNKVPTDTAVVWCPHIESKTISGYVNESMKGSITTKKGKTLINCWLHEDFAQTIIDKPNEEIFDIVKKELNKVCPWFSNEDELENLDLHKWTHAMPKFKHGHLKLVEKFLENGQGQNNVYLTGDYLNSPWTEGALRCGKRVAKQIQKSIS